MAQPGPLAQPGEGVREVVRSLADAFACPLTCASAGPTLAAYVLLSNGSPEARFGALGATGRRVTFPWSGATP